MEVASRLLKRLRLPRWLIELALLGTAVGSFLKCGCPASHLPHPSYLLMMWEYARVCQSIPEYAGEIN